MLERFYDPDSGSIVFGNKYDLKDMNLQWLRANIGIVSQEPFLFDMSIADNIAYGNNSKECAMSDIEWAAKQANIHEFIKNLPKVC